MQPIKTNEALTAPPEPSAQVVCESFEELTQLVNDNNIEELTKRLKRLAASKSILSMSGREITRLENLRKALEYLGVNPYLIECEANGVAQLEREMAAIRQERALRRLKTRVYPKYNEGI